MREIAGFHWQLAADVNYRDCLVDGANIHEAYGPRRGVDNPEYIGVGPREPDGVYVGGNQRVPRGFAQVGQALQRFCFADGVSVQNEDDWLPVGPLPSFGAKDFG